MNVTSLLQRFLKIIPYKLRNKIKNIPILKQLQATLQKKYLDNKEFIATITAGPAKGLTFPVQMPQDKGMWIGTWEIEFSEALAAEIKHDFVCYDIGSYKGYYGGIMAMKGAKKVYLFEPMPKNANKILELIKLNKNLPLQLEQKAVSNANEQLTFYVMEEDTMGKLANSSFMEYNKGQESINVTAVMLDTLVFEQKYMPPNFLKIDVEGAEIFVLKGATKTIEKYKPTMMIEVHSPEIGSQCFNLLKNHYNNIYVLETGKNPINEPLPSICHFVVKS